MKISVKTNKTAITATADCEITSGMVGLQVEIEYGDGWEGLKKFVSFRVGKFKRTRNDVQTETTVPWEVLRKSGDILYIGIEGRNENGDVVIPTVWASVGTIKCGASRGTTSAPTAEGGGGGGEVPPTDELVQAVIDALPVYDGSYTDIEAYDGSYTKGAVE